MIDERDARPADEDAERELRHARKFSMQDAMARLAGPGAMKGASPVSEVQQAENEVGTWLRANVADTAGALKTVLHRHIRGSELLLTNVKQPLVAVATYCERVLGSEQRLIEVVREADVEWGRMMEERPHFDRAGLAPHPEDPYTLASVRAALDDVVRRLR